MLYLDLKEDKMKERSESRMKETTTISVTTYGQTRDFEVITREEIESIISELTEEEIWKTAYANYQRNVSDGVAAVSLESGELFGYSEDYTVTEGALFVELYQVPANFEGITSGELLLDEEEVEPYEEARKEGITLEEFIARTGYSYKERIDNVTNAMLQSMQLDKRGINEKLNYFYG